MPLPMRALTFHPVSEISKPHWPFTHVVVRWVVDATVGTVTGVS
jgi:hypothetical protein